MSTRAAAARETAFIKSSTEQDKITQISSKTTLKSSKPISHGGLVTHGSSRKRHLPRSGKAHVGREPANKENDGTLEEGERMESSNMVEEAGSGEILTESLPLTGPNKKRRKVAAPRDEEGSILVAEPVRGGWDVLPHNMGNASGDTTGNDKPKINHPEVNDSRPKRVRKAKSIKTEETEDNDSKEDIDEHEVSHGNEKSGKLLNKRSTHNKAKSNQRVKIESSDRVHLDPITEELKEESKDENKEIIGIQKIDTADGNLKRKRNSRVKKVDMSSDVQHKVGELLDAAEKQPKKTKKGKASPYGLTPGQSPFPDFKMPTIEACKQVEDALSEVHGKVEAPKEIPAPSLEVTGCGEVPSVLDALIRTRLSASTTSQNAKYAFTGLVERYGILENGIGAGSVDWNKVRESDVLDIEKAIKKGGLAKTKSVSIKKILEMVYEQNMARRDSFLKEKQDGIASDVVGAEKMTEGQKNMEIDVASKKVLSLDFMHGLTADEAMMEFVKYPGIGVKTASCVILFCLQRPSFAVDTHVWRFCKWLKWVPEGATRDQTFSHCEVRVPNEMKYSLHQLFIRHGKTCGRCRAITGEGSEGWESTICPLEHLVERTGKRKTTGPPKKVVGNKKASKGKKGKKAGEDEEDDEDIEMSDLTDIEEPELDDNDQEGIDLEQSQSEKEE